MKSRSKKEKGKKIVVGRRPISDFFFRPLPFDFFLLTFLSVSSVPPWLSLCFDFLGRTYGN
jgi:hypothetical protein